MKMLFINTNRIKKVSTNTCGNFPIINIFDYKY